MEISAFTHDDAAAWDEFVSRSPTAIFLHTRRFLAYHGNRFDDASLILRNEGRIVGLLPAAVNPHDSQCVVSHPGITFGGFIGDGKLRGELMLDAFENTLRHYASQGYTSFRYKPVPYIYHRMPAADDIYALFRLGATIYGCNLSSAIDLSRTRLPATRRRRGLKKALSQGVKVERGPHYSSRLWEVLEENLLRKFGAKPVHSLEEISEIHSFFPDNVDFVVALKDSQVIAGVVLFDSENVSHVQYVASSEVGYTVSALDAVFEDCITRATARGARYFDFGTSNEDEGRRLNAPLYQFKSEFGGGGVAYETYEINLTKS